MYDKLNITENHLQVLSLFTEEFNKEFYIRQVQKLLEISPRTAQLILVDLEDKGILESELKGKIKTYKLKKNKITKNYLIFVEQYKKISFLEKNPLIKEITEKISPFIKGIGIIFGSYTKKTEDKSSDLDIFIAGKYNEKEMKDISKTYNLELNIKCYPLKTFKKELTKDILIKEVLKSHVIFKNIEKFMGIIFENEQNWLVFKEKRRI